MVQGSRALDTLLVFLGNTNLYGLSAALLMLIHPIEVLCANTTILNTLVHQLVACFVLVYAFGCYDPV